MVLAFGDGAVAALCLLAGAAIGGGVWVGNQAPGGAALGVENRSTSAATAIRRTTYDQVHSVSGWAWLRRDSDKNNAPRARLMLAR